MFNPGEIIKRLEKKGFEKVWEEYSRKIPEKGGFLPTLKGKGHSLIDFILFLRECLIELGFEEVINPMIIDESEVYKQYGPEAPVILDRIYYLAGLPRPDVGLGKEEIERIKREVGEIDFEELRKIFREYRERRIEADDLFEEMKRRLKIDQKKVNKLFKIFENFFKLKPEPTSLTLRSHMTGGWFLTIRDLLEYRSPPLYLFSIDWCFRREQKVDEKHLRYYHSCSIAVVDEELSIEMGFEIVKRILNKIGIKDFEIKKKESTARYYAIEKEWEVFYKGIEIGTFGFFNPISLARYRIEFPVFNFGIGVERLYMTMFNENDVRKVVFPQKFFEFTDENIAKSIKPIKEPRTEYGRKIEKILIEAFEKYKDKIGPFEEKVYEDDKVRIFILEPDENKKFAGPAAFNKIFVKDGNIISSLEEKEGIYLGRYCDLIAKFFAYKIEKGEEGIFRIRWVEGPSDINLRIPKGILRWMHQNNKRIEIKGPVFLDIKVEFL